jgi:outer membrane protein assembly factor BamB
MLTRRGAALLALGVLSCHGASDASPDASANALGTPGVVGASIAVVSNGTRVAVVNPDQGSVSFLDPDSLDVLGTTAVGGEPHTLLELTTGAQSTLYVATYRGGEVLAIDARTGKVQKRISVCAGPYGLAASPDLDRRLVRMGWDRPTPGCGDARGADDGHGSSSPEGDRRAR